MGDVLGPAALVINTATSYEAARRTNAAAMASARSNIATAERQQRMIDRGAVIQSRQVERAAKVEQLKRQNESAQIEGRLRAIAADRGGVGNGGTMALLLQQAAYDDATNARLINENLANALQNINSERRAGILSTQSSLQANLVALQSRTRNPLLSGLSAAFQTAAGTGLQIPTSDTGDNP